MKGRPIKEQRLEALNEIRGGHSTAVNHEEEVIRAFILPNQRDRYLEFLTTPKKRTKFIGQLAHFKHLNPKFAFSVPSGEASASALLKLLKAKGAGPKCWIASENRELDAQEMDLETALKATIGYGMGTIISCIAGKLAYFEDEDERYILQRLTHRS